MANVKLRNFIYFEIILLKTTERSDIHHSSFLFFRFFTNLGVNAVTRLGIFRCFPGG
jgi:phosphate starvation-inducible membrane PsiE